MPNNQIKGLAEKYDVPISKAEKAWNEAKGIVEGKYENIDVESDQFYKLTYSIARNKLKGTKMSKTAETLKELGKRYYIRKYAQYKADKAKQSVDYLAGNKILEG